MNMMIPFTSHPNHHKRKVSTMTNDNTQRSDITPSELLELRREKRRERRARQLQAFYQSIYSQNTDKIICLFDNDMNIA